MLTLRKFDLKTREWLPESESVCYRQTLLESMYPDAKLAIADASGFLGKDANLDGAIAALGQGFEGYVLDGATGSRKYGRCIVANVRYFNRFFPSDARCISHGSILLTELQSLTVFSTIRILVVQDGEFHTGDCHGKMSAEFAKYVNANWQHPIQFRMGVRDSWVAKGTLATDHRAADKLPMGVDLILPLSCFKGNKLSVGVHDVKMLHFGIHSQATKRWVKASYTVTQWWKSPGAIAEILEGAVATANHLVKIQSDVRELVEFLDKDYSPDEEEVDCTEFLPDAGGSMVTSIVKADKHGQLLRHPYICSKVQDMVRKNWLRLATAGAMQGHSLMGQPCDDITGNTVVTGELSEGEYIMFRYPVRHWGDIIKVQVVSPSRDKSLYPRHLNQLVGYFGCCWMSHELAAKVGGDFDGK